MDHCLVLRAAGMDGGLSFLLISGPSKQVAVCTGLFGSFPGRVMTRRWFPGVQRVQLACIKSVSGLVLT